MTTATTYLSIDLDYWTGHRSDRGMRRFIDRCLSFSEVRRHLSVAT